MAEPTPEKKHKPTARRRQKAREQGKVAKSQDLCSSGLLLATVGFLWWGGQAMGGQMADYINHTFSQPLQMSMDLETATISIRSLLLRAFIIAVPMLVLIASCSVILHLAQSGLILNFERIAPDINRLNPFSNLGQLFSWRNLGRSCFGVAKLVVMLGVASASIYQNGYRLLGLGMLPIGELAQAIFSGVLEVCVWIGVAAFFLSFIDYGIQKWLFERELMMSDEELREELREIEGDPALADQRRALRQKLTASAQIEPVPSQVILNSEH